MGTPRNISEENNLVEDHYFLCVNVLRSRNIDVQNLHRGWLVWTKRRFINMILKGLKVGTSREKKQYLLIPQLDILETKSLVKWYVRFV